MNTTQALAHIKAVMDAAAAVGIFRDLASAATAANAFNVLAEAVAPQPEKTEGQQ